ncbi:MAG TPA: S41 family peptidase [Actinomycetota bacterium]|nr:S41 family peptidase [Actinomycetota bacterium]
MLKRYSTKILAGFAALAVASAFFVFGFTVGRSRAPQSDKYEVLEEAEERIDSMALTEPDRNKLLQGAVKGMLEGLDDPHSLYYTPQAYRALGEELLTGQFSGVGVWLNRSAEMTKIVSVLPNTPAAEAGIEPGDLITAVDGKPVAGMELDEVGQRIAGEPGTQVVVKVVRGAGAPREFTLSRRKLEIPSVKSEMVGDVGVVNILSFTGGVGQKVRDAVAGMQGRGAKGFVLDLRGNPGGSLDEAVQVASVFIEGGTIVAYRERGKSEVVYQARGPVGTKLPLVVLVDEGSASASEIVAGAIQDRQRGILVGTETYKKGSVQRVVGLSDGSAIKLTVASYFTPSGRGIGEHGVLPDVEVAERARQLPKATEILSGMLAEAPTKAAS